MTYLRNPVSGEVKSIPVLALALNLQSYGWIKISKAEFQSAKREILQYVIAKRLKHVKITIN